VEIHNAGHWPAIIVGRGGVLRIESTGLPLGMFCDSDFSATRVHLESGDAMFLYTDGLLEARRGDDEYGVDRVAHLVRQQAARRPCELVAACLDDMRDFADGPPLDDLALLAIQRVES
jgi:phosphoserine phosphatase RsbU/P